MRLSTTAIVLLAAVFTQACSDRQEKVDTPNATENDTTVVVNKSAAQPAGQKTVSGKIHAGRVLSLVASGGYTYLEVDAQGRRLWLAGNQVNAKEGQQVRWGDYVVMRDFHSKTLDKKFEQILFVTRVVPAAQEAQHSQPTAGVASEVISSGGYVYVAAELGPRKIWLAAPDVEINVGDSLSWESGSVMRNFYSKTLDRSFDEILFVSVVAVTGAN